MFDSYGIERLDLEGEKVLDGEMAGKEFA